MYQTVAGFVKTAHALRLSSSVFFESNDLSCRQSAAALHNAEPSKWVSKRAPEFERACVGRATVAPHWLPGNDVFWYRQSPPSDKWQFVAVNCARGIVQPAFDHKALAYKLSSDGFESPDPDKLPLSSLNVDPDGSWVRFQYSGKTWQFSKDQTLEHWHGEFFVEDFEQDYDISKPSSKKSPGTVR